MTKHPATNKKDKRTLLIENSEFITKIELGTSLKESLEMSAGKNGTMIVKNVPCTILNRENQNGRVYSTEIMQVAISEAKQLHLFEQKQLLSQADEHPEGSFVAPSHASHVVINAYIKPNVKIVVEGAEEQHDVLFMDWEVLNTQEGKNLRALLEAECSIGTSIRGVGDLKGKSVENYSILGVDIVGNPSSSTYTRMPVSESVKVEVKDPRDLKETFTISTSSTNVVRDLEAAARIQEQLDSIGYGTVTKTSTKVDEETDPKTGAQTSITTLEAETSDDVADLDQALMMAKNAMLNGTVNVDSITIENIKEEEPKESACNGNEKALKEEEFDILTAIEDLSGNVIKNPTEEQCIVLAKELRKNLNNPNYHKSLLSLARTCKERGFGKDLVDYAKGVKFGVNDEYLPTKLKEEDRDNDEERYGTCSWCGEEFPLSDLKKEKDLGYVCNHCAKGIESREGPLSWENEYVPESAMNEGVDKLKDAISAIMYNEGLTLEQACRKFCEQHENIPYDYVLEYMRPTVTEAKEENKEDPNTGKKFVLKTPAGFVAMDGNALVFKDDPKEALHFIVGKEESGLVHLSGVEKILDTMGVYDVEKYYRKEVTDISAPEEGNGVEPVEEGLLGGTVGAAAGGAIGGAVAGPLGALSGAASGYSLGSSIGDDLSSDDKQESTLEEGDSKFSAKIKMTKEDGTESSEELPITSTEMSSVLNEVANHWKQKSESGKGRVDITVVDNTTGQSFMYNPQSNSLDPIQQQVQQEAFSGQDAVEQNNNTLSVKVDDNNTVAKEFDNPVQASVAKAGLEQGKLDGDVMMTEAGDPIGVDLTTDQTYNGKLGPVPYTLWFKCTDNNFDLLDSDLKKLYDKRVIWNWDQHSSMPNVLYVTGLNEQGCNALLNNLRKMGNKLVSEDFMQVEDESVKEADSEKNIDKTNNRYEDVVPGWYAAAEGIGVTGPFASEEEAWRGLEDVRDYVTVEYIDPAELEEKLYTNPSEPSDPYVDTPLNDSTESMKEEKVKVVLSDLNWDEQGLVDSYDPEANEFHEYVNNLPDTITLDMDTKEFDNDDPSAVKQSILNAAKKRGYNVADAVIQSIE